MLKNISALFFLFGILLTAPACAQVVVPTELPAIENKAFNNRLQELLSFSVPLMGVKELAEANREKYVILDARELEEYEISHIPGAKYFGYDNPNWEELNTIDKDQPIVLYCSVGYRSEKIGEKFKAQGYTEVYNLYGSIFEWANSGQPLETAEGKETKQVHTYNKRWSKWVQKNKDLEKIW